MLKRSRRDQKNTWEKKTKEYMEDLYKKDLNEPDYYDDVVSHPEPDTGVQSHVGFKKH